MKRHSINLFRAICCLATTLMLAFVPLNLCGCSDDVDYTFYTSIVGSVIDEHTEIPLKNVEITISPSNSAKSTRTDENGIFEFSNLDVQKYTLIFQKSGYKTTRREVTPIVGEISRVDISLSKLPN